MRGEKNFLVELKNTFLEMGGFFYKIPDSPIFHNQQTRFTPPKPFDALLILNKKPIAIEAKYISEYKSFGRKALTPSQIMGLCDFQSAGGEAYVFLNVRRKTDKKLGIERLNRLIIFDWTELRTRQDSYSKSELQQLPYSKGFKGQFDLRFIYDRLF